MYFLADVIAGLASAEELAKGASIAQEGLVVPPSRVPAPSVLASRPSPANVTGPGEFVRFHFCILSKVVCLLFVLIAP
jgi:hypothetical protein